MAWQHLPGKQGALLLGAGEWAPVGGSSLEIGAGGDGLCCRDRESGSKFPPLVTVSPVPAPGSFWPMSLSRLSIA